MKLTTLTLAIFCFILTSFQTQAQVTITNNSITTSNTIKGEGPVQTQTRNLPAFDSILIKGSVTLNMSKGDYKGLNITAHKNLLDIIETTVSGQTLTISSKKSYSSQQPIVIDYSAPKIKTLIIEGTVSTKLRGLDQNMLIIRQKGTGNVYADGKINLLILDHKGAGQMMVKDLISQNTKVSLTGTGYVFVHAEKTLNVSIQGVGKIEYTGKPTITKKISGIGQLIDAN